MCGSFLYGPKDPWARVLSLLGRFVGDPASLARDNMYYNHDNSCATCLRDALTFIPMHWIEL